MHVSFSICIHALALGFLPSGPRGPAGAGLQEALLSLIGVSTVFYTRLVLWGKIQFPLLKRVAYFNLTLFVLAKQFLSF